MNAAGKILKYKMRENAVEKYGSESRVGEDGVNSRRPAEFHPANKNAAAALS